MTFIFICIWCCHGKLREKQSLFQVMSYPQNWFIDSSVLIRLQHAEREKEVNYWGSNRMFVATIILEFLDKYVKALESVKSFWVKEHSSLNLRTTFFDLVSGDAIARSGTSPPSSLERGGYPSQLRRWSRLRRRSPGHHSLDAASDRDRNPGRPGVHALSRARCR